MRSITTADALAVAELDMELFPDNCFNETTLAKEIASGGGVVIYDGEVLAAYLLARWDWSILDIIRIGVRPAYQGKGLGTKMLFDAISCSHLDVLLCVNRKNHRAIKLYLQHGFEITGKFKGSWVMLRTTSSAG